MSSRWPLVLLLVAAAPARGEVVDATSMTLLSGHADPRDGRVYTVVPAYESLTLSASELRIPLVQDGQLVVRAWGEIGFDTQRDLLRSTGDVDALYLAGKFYKRHFEFRLGRQLVFGGAARVTQMDGLQLTGFAPRGFGLTVYGGAPVTPRFGVHRGDAMVGARAFWRASIASELGLSIIDVLDRGVASRRDVGFDGRVAVTPTLFFDAYALYSLVELRFAEAQVAGTWAPLRQLEVAVDAHHTAPDLFLPRTSIFAVFSNETHDELGGRVYGRPWRWIRLYGDYHYISSSAGTGHRGGVKAMLSPDSDSSLGLEVRELWQSSTGGYLQARMFTADRLAHDLVVTFDSDVYIFDRPLNGQQTSFTGAGTVGWDFAPHWRLVLSALVDRTPLVDWRFEAMAKLVFNQMWRTRSVQ